MGGGGHRAGRSSNILQMPDGASRGGAKVLMFHFYLGHRVAKHKGQVTEGQSWERK